MIAETKPELPAYVRKALDSLDSEVVLIERRKQTVLRNMPAAIKVEEVLKPFIAQSAPDGPWRSIEIVPSDGHALQPVTVYLYYVRDLRSMVPLLEACHAAGYRAITTFDADDALWRTYRREGLTVTAFLAKDAVCRRVQVGTKTVPVYEIQCGEPNAKQDMV